MFLIINIHTVLQSSYKLRMLSMLGVVLYVLSIISARTNHAQAQNHPWYDAKNLYIADTDAIHIVDTRNIYIDLRSCYIADTAAIHIVDTRNIHLMNQDIFISAQSNEEEFQTYNINNLLLQISNRHHERYAKGQNKYTTRQIRNIPHAQSPTIAAQVSASVHSPWWPNPFDIPTKRKENAYWANSSPSSSFSKSKIQHPTLDADILRIRYGESTHIRRYRSQICSQQINNKDKYSITSGLRGPPFRRYMC